MAIEYLQNPSATAATPEPSAEEVERRARQKLIEDGYNPNEPEQTFDSLYEKASVNPEKSGDLLSATRDYSPIGQVAVRKGLVIKNYNHETGTGIPELRP